MNHLFKATFLLIFCSSSLVANDSQYIRKVEPEIEKAHALMATLDNDIQAYLSSLEHNMRVSEDDLKRMGQWDQELRNLNALKGKIEGVQNLFLEFRKNASQMVSLQLGDNREADSLYAYSTLEITEWYVKYIEEMLFPRDR